MSLSVTVVHRLNAMAAQSKITKDETEGGHMVEKD